MRDRTASPLPGAPTAGLAGGRDIGSIGGRVVGEATRVIEGLDPIPMPKLPGIVQ